MTAPATPTVTVTALDWIIDAGYDRFMEYATETDIDALAVTRALIETALGTDSIAFSNAAAAYRNWAPTAAAATGDGATEVGE